MGTLTRTNTPSQSRPGSNGNEGFLIFIFTNSSSRAGYDTRANFKWSLTGLNSEFSFSLTSCLTKAEEPSLPYYLSIAGWRLIGFIPFPRVLALCEMQSVTSRIWTHVTVSISYDDNYYTTGFSVRSLIIRWFSIISRTLLAGGGFIPLCRDATCIF